MTFKYFYKLFVRHTYSHIRKLRIENPLSLNRSLITRVNGRDIRTDAIIVSSFPISKLEPLIQIGAASYSNPVELDLKKGPISLATCRQHPSFSLFEFPGLFVCAVPLRASISSELCAATSGRKLNVSARRVLIDTSRNNRREYRSVVVIGAYESSLLPFFRGSASYRHIRLYDFVHGEIINFHVITGFCN